MGAFVCWASAGKHFITIRLRVAFFFFSWLSFINALSFSSWNYNWSKMPRIQIGKKNKVREEPERNIEWSLMFSRLFNPLVFFKNFPLYCFFSFSSSISFSPFSLTHIISSFLFSSLFFFLSFLHHRTWSCIFIPFW